MKRKIYYVIYALLQVGLGIFTFLNCESIAKEALKSISNDLEFDLNTLALGYKMLAVVSVVIGLILLVRILKDGRLINKVSNFCLLVAAIFTSSLSITILLSVVALVLMVTDKDAVDVKKKEKKKIPQIRNLKSTKKDYISAAILILVFFGQLLLVPLIYKITNNYMFSTIFYDLIILSVAVWAFIGKYKSDFRHLKDNFSAYLRSSLKYWLLMLGVVLVAGVIMTFLGAKAESGNQEALKTLPLWYLIPSAIIFAPIVEEAVFRGSLRRFIKNDVAFIIVSALTFGLLHTFLSEEGLYSIIVQSINYVAMGGALAYSYTKTNNIYTSMMVHAFQNTFGVLMIIFQSFI